MKNSTMRNDNLGLNNITNHLFNHVYPHFTRVLRQTTWFTIILMMFSVQTI